MGKKKKISLNVNLEKQSRRVWARLIWVIIRRVRAIVNTAVNWILTG
jgi:hypothetical protein